MSQGVFGQEVRTAVWMDYIGMYVVQVLNTLVRYDTLEKNKRSYLYV